LNIKQVIKTADTIVCALWCFFFIVTSEYPKNNPSDIPMLILILLLIIDMYLLNKFEIYTSFMDEEALLRNALFIFPFFVDLIRWIFKI
jgi:hypothetical protein